MSSEFEAEFESVALPELFAEFGEEVTHRPLANSANDAVVVAIWQESQPERVTQYGDEQKRTGTLWVRDSVTTDPRDEWVIESEVWQTVRKSAKSMAGFLKLYLQRNDKQNVKGKRGPLL